MTAQNLSRFILFILLVAGGILAIIYRDLLSSESLENFVLKTGLWGPVVYTLLWFVVPVFLIPGGILSLLGGALFGVFWGTFYTVLGATVGATIAFLISRYLAGEWVEKKVKGSLANVRKGVEAEGWRFVAFTRLVPIFPFILLNYAFGLTRLSLKQYVLPTFLGMIPCTIGYSYVGYAGREFLQGGDQGALNLSIGISIFVGVTLIPLMVRRYRVLKKRKKNKENKEHLAASL